MGVSWQKGGGRPGRHGGCQAALRIPAGVRHIRALVEEEIFPDKGDLSTVSVLGWVNKAWAL